MREYLFLSGRSIASPKLLLLMLFFAAAGYLVVHVAANRKWGYTREREKELETEKKERKGL